MSCFLPATAQAGASIKPIPPTPLPALSFLDENGAKQTLQATGAPLTVLHFWATWCIPCVAELPEVDQTQAKYGKKLRIIALSLDGNNNAKVKAFFAEHHITQLKPFLDADMSAFQALRINGLPSTLFVDAKGNEIARAEGPLGWESKEVKAFIAERTQ